MATIELSPGCRRWNVGDLTTHPPGDVEFLAAVVEAGYVAFTGPGGLCGGKTERRTVLVIHRGQGTKWEIVFRENEVDVVTTTTTDLGAMTSTLVAWLKGHPLLAEKNSVHAMAG